MKPVNRISLFFFFFFFYFFILASDSEIPSRFPAILSLTYSLSCYEMYDTPISTPEQFSSILLYIFTYLHNKYLK